MEPDYDLRAASASAILAEQLRRCILAHLHGKPFPGPEAVNFDDPEQIDHAFRTVAALSGLDPDDEHNIVRMLRLFQALAEMLAEQGADLEITLHNIISVTLHKELVKMPVEAAE